MSQSIDDMDAYMCVTDNVLHQIKAFGVSANQPEGIRKAQEIIKRIESRKLYKMIAEKRVTFGSSVCMLSLRYLSHVFGKREDVLASERCILLSFETSLNVITF